MDTGAMTQAATAVAVTDRAEKKKTSGAGYGKTIGSPELSEKAKKYYEQLKNKYANMDFILVSENQKAQAESQAGKYANANRMVVLIDTEKVEKMAEDESYRKKYEGIISGATARMEQLKSGLTTSGASVKTFGMKINDGGNASFFAVIDKSLEAQKKRIEKKAEKKAEEKKKAARLAEEKRAEKKEAGKTRKEQAEEGDYVTVTASSVEELLKKIDDTLCKAMSDRARTEEEKKIGQNIDFSA